jgi:toxin ParE1/3/4
MPHVLRTRRANLDLLEIWSYVAQDSPQAADRLIERLDQHCERLASFPEMGRLRDELAPSLRSLVVSRYVVFYRPAEDGIEVIRVLHGARDVAAILRGESEGS